MGLAERHPDLFELAKQYEKIDSATGEQYTWTQRELLEELSPPERMQEIKEQHQKTMEAKYRVDRPLLQLRDPGPTHLNYNSFASKGLRVNDLRTPNRNLLVEFAL